MASIINYQGRHNFGWQDMFRNLRLLFFTDQHYYKVGCRMDSPVEKSATTSSKHSEQDTDCRDRNGQIHKLDRRQLRQIYTGNEQTLKPVSFRKRTIQQPSSPTTEAFCRTQQSSHPIHNTPFQIILSSLMQLTEAVTVLSSKVQSFDQRITDLQDKNREESDGGRKKGRGKPKQVVSTYVCPYKACQKIYRTEISFNLHLKVKHSGLVNTINWEKQHKTSHAKIESQIYNGSYLNRPVTLAKEEGF